MSPTTAAKHAGYDWKALSTEERKLVCKVSRAMNRRHEEQMGKLRLVLLDLADQNHRLKDRLKIRINEIINRKAKKR